MKKTDSKAVLVRLPMSLMKKLDASAKKQARPRVAEIRLRLAGSFSKNKAERAT